VPLSDEEPIPVKVGGGLNYVTGPMGSGKSFYGVRRIVEYAIAGKYCVTNVELYDDWATRVAWHVGVGYKSMRKRTAIADRLRSYYVYETSLQQAMRYRLPGRGEARGVFVWDESHNDLNNRSWRDDGRQEVLEWGTQLRKLGFVGYLLSQHADNTDAALRRVCNYHVRLQNQREQTRMLGLRVTPWPLFLAVWLPTNTPLVSSQKPMKVERYFLNWQRKLYDTHGLYHGLDIDTGVEVVQLPDGGLAAKPLPPDGHELNAGPMPVPAPAPLPIELFTAADGTQRS